VGGFFVLMTAQGLIGPNAGALASGQVPEHPGTGSAVLGFLQWCTAGVIAPIAGLGGQRTAVPMAVIVLALVAASFTALLLLARPRSSKPGLRLAVPTRSGRGRMALSSGLARAGGTVVQGGNRRRDRQPAHPPRPTHCGR
jgi:hypothetical protein